MSNYTEQNYDISKNNYWKGTTEGPNHGYPKNYFYAGTMRNISIAFTNFFNDLYVVRYDEKGIPVKNIQVPIKFGPRMKSFDYRVELESGKTYTISYPNLAWRFTSIEFDAERFSGQYAERVFYNDTLEEAGIDYVMSDKFWGDVQPAPYNINVSMELKCDLLSDATQVIEQIGARFTPDVNIDIKEFWFFNKRRATAMTLEGAPEITVESESIAEDAKREITVTFNFKIFTNFYKPIKNAAIIDKINTYLTVQHNESVWHSELYGDYDKSVTNRYNFEDLFDCKVGLVSAWDGNPVVTFDEKSNTYKTTYNYLPTEDYTFYPEGTKIIKSISNQMIQDENGEYHNKIVKEYYDIGAYGTKPDNIEIRGKTIYNSYGEPYIGYYVNEIENLTKEEYEAIKQKIREE